MTVLRPGPLPTYDWASRQPHSGLVGDWAVDLPPVRAASTARLPDSPPPSPGDLEVVAHPRIRNLAAYWHEGWPHSGPTAWLRPEAATRLGDAVSRLPDGFGLAIWDAWRDPRLQQCLHDTVYQDTSLPPDFVAEPDPDPRRCPPHATGGTVDLTLTWRNEPLALGTRFDAFVPEAAAAALEPDGPLPARDLRRLLASVLSACGFVVLPQEWWHWEYGTRWWAAVEGSRPLFGHGAPPATGAAPVTGAS